MNIPLIPQPQVVQSRGPEPVSGIRGWTVQLWSPGNDVRLLAAAQGIFAGVTVNLESGGSSVYALVSEGTPSIPAWPGG